MKRSVPIAKAVAVFLFGFGGTTAVADAAQDRPARSLAPSAPVEVAAAKSPWERIVIVGASASAGFTASEPLGGPTTPLYRLSRYLDAALLVPHEPVRNLANAMFFIKSEDAGRNQIEEALQQQPSLVIGLDFLFWFCYGDGPTDDERLKRFESGLKLLEAVKCPLVVGDIPDASAAANSVLSPDEIPSVQAMSAANRRLKEWAATRPQVIIVALSGFVRAAMADQALSIRSHTLPAGKTRILLQDDKLHPSPPGCAVLAVAILDAIQSSRPGIPARDVRWNPKEVFRLGFKPAPQPAISPAKQTTATLPAGN